MTNETEYAEFGFTRGEQFLQRKPDWNKVEVFEDSVWEKYRWEISLAVLVFILSGLIFAGMIFTGAGTIKKDTLSYQDVHTEEQACAYLKSHPGSIKNVKWCNY